MHAILVSYVPILLAIFVQMSFDYRRTTAGIYTFDMQFLYMYGMVWHGYGMVCISVSLCVAVSMMGRVVAYSHNSRH